MNKLKQNKLAKRGTPDIWYLHQTSAALQQDRTRTNNVSSGGRLYNETSPQYVCSKLFEAGFQTQILGLYGVQKEVGVIGHSNN